MLSNWEYPIFLFLFDSEKIIEVSSNEYAKSNFPYKIDLKKYLSTVFFIVLHVDELRINKSTPSINVLFISSIIWHNLHALANGVKIHSG